MFSRKKDNTLSIILPVFDEPELIAKFVNGNKRLLQKYPVLVLDGKGGDSLKEYATFYKKTICPTIGWPLGSSRRFLTQRVQTEFTFNLDVDVLLPANFVQEALKKFRAPLVGAVALNYEKPQSHLAFGPSIWRTKILQELYDWEHWKTNYCECLYMWDKLRKAGYKLETLDMCAKHLKSWGDSVTKSRGGFSNCSRKVVNRLIGNIKL